MTKFFFKFKTLYFWPILGQFPQFFFLGGGGGGGGVGGEGRAKNVSQKIWHT